MRPSIYRALAGQTSAHHTLSCENLNVWLSRTPASTH